MDQQTTSGSANIQEVPAVHNARITGSEVASLWTTFQEYTMLNCVFSYMERTVQDQATRQIIADLLPLLDARARFAAEIFTREGIAMSKGFTEQDVNLNAPALYSDVFVLHFLRNMIRVQLTLNALHLSMSNRPDIRDYYTDILGSVTDFNTRVTDLMLAKGVLARPPFLSLAPDGEPIHDSSFLAGFLMERRPLLTIEVAHLYHNALSNDLGRALLLGFRQVSRHREVQDYFEKGLRLADDIVRELQTLTQNEYVYMNLTQDADVTASTEAPFSDRLMMFLITSLNSISGGMLGVSAGVSMRHDLLVMYGKYMAQIGRYAHEGIKLMIANHWMEEPPQILNREKLAAPAQHLQ